MRQVVPLLETNARIGETSPVTALLTAAAAISTSPLLDGQHDLDAGRLPNSAATRVLADELHAERDGYEPPYGLSGYELNYGVPDRMADGPHHGWDGRDVGDLHEELIAPTGASTTDIGDPWSQAPSATETAANTPAAAALVDAGDAAALLLAESALLSQIEQHRQMASRESRVAGGEQSIAATLASTPDDPATRHVDEHHESVNAPQPHLALVDDAGAHAQVERSPAQALAASYPTAVTDVTATAAAAAASVPGSTSTKQTVNPQVVRSL
jgi:hypothetical protein